MTTLKKSRPESRTRAESLSRMLELEKKYKMQRLQDIGSTPSPTPPESAITRSASSARPNSALKARRASALPAVAHHFPHMTMQAARRSSGLPSLSISVPPPPTTAVPTGNGGAEANVRQVPVGKDVSRDVGDRAKTVTFSNQGEVDEGEDEVEDAAELSDQSSICHSPSWAVYGQNKKKDKKREAAQLKKEQEKQVKAAKNNTQTKRLSKALQKNTGQRPSMPSDRSLSAPELEQHQRLAEGNMKRSISHYPPDSMANHQNLFKQPPADDPVKPKTKGFFSSLRFTQNNTADQKTEHNTRSSMDNSGFSPGGPAFAVQMPSIRGDADFMHPRKPPSIKSNQSSSTHSQSSSERQSGNGRKGMHGRSHSLIAKLKGPSYLYSKSAEVAEEESETRPSSAGQIEYIAEPVLRAQESTPIVYDAQSSRSTARRDVAKARGRQLQAHVAQQRDSSSEYEGPPNISHRYIHPRQDATDMPVANEARRRPANYTEKIRARHQDSMEMSSTSPPPPRRHEPAGVQAYRVHETRRHVSRLDQHQEPAHYHVAVVDHPTPTTSPRSDQSYATVYTDAVEQLSENYSPHAETESIPARPQVSSTRPSPRKDKRNKVQASTKSPEQSLSPVTEPDEIFNYSIKVHESKQEPQSSDDLARSNKTVMPPPEHSAKANRPKHVPIKSADYLSFISESYAPPSLELRSPIEDDRQSWTAENEQITNSYEDDDVMWVGIPQQRREKEKHLEGTTASHTVSDVSAEDARSAEFCDSPTLSAQDTEDFVPSLSGLSASSSAAKMPKKHPYQVALEEEPSQSTSERSSSSMCNEMVQPSSTATTPDISRPQSQRDTLSETTTPKPTELRFEDSLDYKELRRSNMTQVVENHSSTRPKSRQDAHNNQQVEVSDSTIRSGITTPVLGDDSASSSPALMAISMPTIYVEPIVEEAPENEIVSEEIPTPRRQPLPPKSQSAIDLATTSFSHPRKGHSSDWRQTKAGLSSVSLPNSLPSSPPPELESNPPNRLRSAMKPPRNDSSDSREALNGAAHLQEARKTAPVPSFASRAVRPMYTSRGSAPLLRNGKSPDKNGEPMAKMLVQCCNCQFFHDMPSRVYECMAKPDSVVEDKLLGVSAAITTTVKCPWCAHGMSTQCCSGYAALVVLKEKLHGK